MTQIPHPYNLGDKGVISGDLQKKKEYPVICWIPSRKIQEHCLWEGWLKKKREVIGTLFSADRYRITGIRVDSISGIKVALDIISLVYSLPHLR